MEWRKETCVFIPMIILKLLIHRSCAQSNGTSVLPLNTTDVTTELNDVTEAKATVISVTTAYADTSVPPFNATDSTLLVITESNDITTEKDTVTSVTEDYTQTVATKKSPEHPNLENGSKSTYARIEEFLIFKFIALALVMKT